MVPGDMAGMGNHPYVCICLVCKHQIYQQSRIFKFGFPHAVFSADIHPYGILDNHLLHDRREASLEMGL